MTGPQFQVGQRQLGTLQSPKNAIWTVANLTPPRVNVFWSVPIRFRFCIVLAALGLGHLPGQ